MPPWKKQRRCAPLGLHTRGTSPERDDGSRRAPCFLAGRRLLRAGLLLRRCLLARSALRLLVPRAIIHPHRRTRVSDDRYGAVCFWHVAFIEGDGWSGATGINPECTGDSGEESLHRFRPFRDAWPRRPPSAARALSRSQRRSRASGASSLSIGEDGASRLQTKTAPRNLRNAVGILRSFQRYTSAYTPRYASYVITQRQIVQPVAALRESRSQRTP